MTKQWSLSLKELNDVGKLLHWFSYIIRKNRKLLSENRIFKIKISRLVE